MSEFKSQAARDAQSQGYGDETYWQYLDRSAQEHFDYHMKAGNETRAKAMLTQSLGEALQGNEGI